MQAYRREIKALDNIWYNSTMKANTQNITLGDEVADRITGFKGVVVIFSTWNNGNVRCTVGPKELLEGKIQDSHAFDIEQLEYIKHGDYVAAPLGKSQNIHNIKLGDIVKDTLSDYEGAVVCFDEHLNGCIRLGVQAKGVSRDKLIPIDAISFDIEHIIPIKDKEAVVPVATPKRHGGNPGIHKLVR